MADRHRMMIAAGALRITAYQLRQLAEELRARARAQSQEPPPPPPPVTVKGIE